MEIVERCVALPRTSSGEATPYRVLAEGAQKVADQEGATPLRIAAVRTTRDEFHCEIALMHQAGERRYELRQRDPFGLRHRNFCAEDSFNVALMIPTGVGAAVGGEAGDATPVARMLGAVCDRIVLHPNVVNASDINEMPPNALYVEGSVLTRLLCGTIALRPVRANRILVVAEETEDSFATHHAVNASAAALATLGADIVEVVRLSSSLSLETTRADSGRASGILRGVDALMGALEARRGSFDAVAITTTIATPGDIEDFVLDYFRSENEVNPWGGVEALLTHAVSAVTGLPSAHAPMADPREHTIDLDVVDPRKAAEAVSKAYLFCALKGLARSPRIVELPPDAHAQPPGTLGIENIAALVLPSGCFGLGVAAAIEQGIPLIEVEDSGSIMDNDLASIVDGRTAHYRARSYTEACGILVALREGITPRCLLRPVPVRISRVEAAQAALATG